MQTIKSNRGSRFKKPHIQLTVGGNRTRKGKEEITKEERTTRPSDRRQIIF